VRGHGQPEARDPHLLLQHRPARLDGGPIGADLEVVGPASRSSIN
jgi:hypothetical protein